MNINQTTDQGAVMSACTHPSSQAPFGSEKNYELTCDYFDPFLDQLAAIYNELDRLPKTAELREALGLVSDLGTLLDHIQHS